MQESGVNKWEWEKEKEKEIQECAIQVTIVRKGHGSTRPPRRTQDASSVVHLRDRWLEYLPSAYSLGTAPRSNDFCTFLGCSCTWVKRDHTESKKALKKSLEKCTEWVWAHHNHLPQLQLKSELGRWHGHQRICHTLSLFFMLFKDLQSSDT